MLTPHLSCLIRSESEILLFKEINNLFSNLLFLFFFSKETGVRKSEVVNWYLEQVSHLIETEAELVEKKSLIEKVLDRLIYHVSKTIFNRQYFFRF